MTSRKLIIEKSDEDGLLWGRTLEDDDLIVDSAPTETDLVEQMKQLLYEFHGVDPNEVVFEIEYDLEAFFQRFDYLKISKVAELAGLNASLVRQYATGKKYPGKKQLEKIESAIQTIGGQLVKLKLLQSAASSA
ncbi:hypothetical protein [Runella zeae]|uniref:hypothetical protein n=1 Tax=Runella zeae TaxID=94255 RepID=UPI002353E788|nr:hypothetical protein [Runella zeae]